MIGLGLYFGRLPAAGAVGEEAVAEAAVETLAGLAEIAPQMDESLRCEGVTAGKAG